MGPQKCEKNIFYYSSPEGGGQGFFLKASLNAHLKKRNYFNLIVVKFGMFMSFELKPSWYMVYTWHVSALEYSN